MKIAPAGKQMKMAFLFPDAPRRPFVPCLSRNSSSVYANLPIALGQGGWATVLQRLYSQHSIATPLPSVHPCTVFCSQCALQCRPSRSHCCKGRPVEEDESLVSISVFSCFSHRVKDSEHRCSLLRPAACIHQRSAHQFGLSCSLLEALCSRCSFVA